MQELLPSFTVGYSVTCRALSEPKKSLEHFRKKSYYVCENRGFLSKNCRVYLLEKNCSQKAFFSPKGSLLIGNTHFGSALLLNKFPYGLYMQNAVMQSGPAATGALEKSYCSLPPLLFDTDCNNATEASTQLGHSVKHPA